jgi:choline-sulfatase
MTDEQRADSLSYSGTPWARTPHLDRLAQSGTRFTAAYTPSPVCVSARASILTGRYCSSIGIFSNHHVFNQEDPQFLTKVFSENGYQVASFGKHHYNCGQRAFDLEHNYVLGDRVHYFDYKVPVDEEEAGVVRYTGGKSPWLFAGRFPGTVDDTPEMHTVHQALGWMKARDTTPPFFLRVSLNAPHTPVVTPAPFDTMIDPGSIQLPIDWSQDMVFVSKTHKDYLCDYAGTHRLTETQIRRARQCYYGYVACTDHILGRLLDVLEEMGVMENTIIVFVSDHGTHLGERGFFQKQSYWDASSRVPFFFSGTGIEKQIVDTPVSTGSLLPTLIELAGLPIPKRAQFPSLHTTVRNSELPEERPIFSEIDYGIWNYRNGDRYVMVRDGKYKLMLYHDPGDPGKFSAYDDRVLFDLARDPREETNLASQPVYAPLIDSLIAQIGGWDRNRPIIKPTVIQKA